MRALHSDQLSDDFRRSLPVSSRLEPKLRAALTQVLETPGSLVRPRIVLEIADAYRIPEEAARDLAIALEYFHTASLIFDDMPSMDDAEPSRREGFFQGCPGGGRRVIFLKLILTNLQRHRIRSFISIAGITFSVAAMLTVVTILQGAVGMFSNILSNDSQIIVFEKNVSDLFFSSVPAHALHDMQSWPMVDHADPVLFGIVC